MIPTSQNTQSTFDIILNGNSDPLLMCILDRSSLGLLFNENGIVQHASSSFSKMVGLTGSEMKTRNFKWTDLTPPGSRALDEAGLEELLRTGSAAPWEKEYVLEDGRRVSVCIQLQRLERPIDGCSYVALLTEITAQAATEKLLEETLRALSVERRRLEKRNRDSGLLNELRSRFASCSSSDRVFATLGEYLERFFPETNGLITFVGTSPGCFSARFKWGMENLSKTHYERSECSSLITGSMQTTRESPDTLCSHFLLRDEGRYLCVPYSVRGETAGALHIHTASQRINETVEERTTRGGWIEQMAIAVAGELSLALTCCSYRERVQLQSIRDEESGLYNRTSLLDSMRRELTRAERAGVSCTLFMLEIDGLQDIIQKHGADAPKSMFRVFGARIEAAIRAGDLAGRFENDILAVFMIGMALSGLEQRAMTLRCQLFEEPLDYKGTHIKHPDVRIGICFKPEAVNGTVNEMIDCAAATLDIVPPDGIVVQQL